MSKKKEALGFRCPRCEGEALEEVLIHAIVVQQIIGFDEEEDSFEYGEEMDLQEGEVEHYQCESCGWVVPVGNNEAELKAFLKGQNNMGTRK